ncbi:MAG: aminotransferase class I/II-fold pyridoxal phosphate-dependent enzyme [Rhodospirillales bacterium]|nr:aminotransferase class I/II-fold pyridoxal phosphate-dependent enzyme [Rhodospirillales bacterium]MCB9964649.1 aminotransferase class I/II-fold pyridoxal phosphate-dependent enzyme [Rhodospirillales bacterium]MCB9979939.1 aminotransferase class I/II-fold pyridoxal phosphate-dependent enzyme [Rhodospirillales bacterium]
MVKLFKTATEFELSPTLHTNELVGKMRSEGKQVLHMGFGQSSFPPPERVVKALQDHAAHNEYLPTAGLPALRQAVAAFYREKMGIDTDQYDILIAPGSKLILYALQMAIEGDLLLPVPSWVSYEPQAKMLQTRVIKVPTRLDDAGYHIDPEVLRTSIRQARAQGYHPAKIILNYPNNPTGLVFTDQNMRDIARICEEEDIFIIADEIYGFISFDKTYRSISRFAKAHTAISTGLSKHFSLGGWRVGIGFIPKSTEGLFGVLCNIASEMWSCVPAPIQYAVIEAYQTDADIEKHYHDCAAIHGYLNKYIARHLRALGLDAPEPQGAFYNYPNFDPYRSSLKGIGITTSKDLSEYLLSTYGLASLPGVAFGADPEVLTLRLSGCDYSGAAALHAYQNGEELTESFIAAHAPNIQAQVEAFAAFIDELTAETSKGIDAKDLQMIDS